MTEILGAVVLAAVVSLLFFTKDGRALFEQFADALDERLILVSNLRQRRRERARAVLLPFERRRTSWEWRGRKEWE